MRLLISFSFLFLLIGCLARKKQNQNQEFTAVNYIVKIPVSEDTTGIYYYKDLVIYQLPYLFIVSDLDYDSSGSTFLSEASLYETRYHYFVCRQGKPFGLWYDSTEQMNSGKRMSMDSVYKEVGTFKNLHSTGEMPQDTLIETINSNNGNDIVKKYIPKGKPIGQDSTLLYFSKSMRDIPFSILPYYDSLYGAKLCNLKVVYNDGRVLADSVKIQKTEFSWTIERRGEIDRDKLKNLIKHFWEDEARLL